MGPAATGRKFEQANPVWPVGGKFNVPTVSGYFYLTSIGRFVLLIGRRASEAIYVEQLPSDYPTCRDTAVRLKFLFWFLVFQLLAKTAK